MFTGTSAVGRHLAQEIEMAARSEAKVLITGETGVGKDMVARSLHAQSQRRSAPLSTINCAGLPDTLLESELFGHVRGSFTGAFRDKAGLLEAADRGTAFLDEAGEMSTRMQGVLLRFLETGEIQRVGSERAVRRVNVRVIAATNRNLSRQIADGAFREDLYYRLNVIRIHVPALRERREDIAGLFAHFADHFSRHYGVAPRALSPEARAVLLNYRWPGNIRELKNVVERLIVKAPGATVEVADLPAECLSSSPVLAFPTTQPARPDGHATEPGAEMNDEHQDFDIVQAHARDASVAVRVATLFRRMTDAGESFWDAVHAPFMARDLSRSELRGVIRAGLEHTGGNYRVVVELFNMAPGDYKRFLGFLRKHDCHVPFHAFRAVRHRPANALPPRPSYLSAVG
ncbi:MAG: sigma-54-dependent Fis family transcriptional regulator [Acidobacteria bacterium]|nr:sigma-54-dependent Fis family transcriptional regulator [Acidobacteriota bacterium]